MTTTATMIPIIKAHGCFTGGTTVGVCAATGVGVNVGVGIGIGIDVGLIVSSDTANNAKTVR